MRTCVKKVFHFVGNAFHYCVFVSKEEKKEKPGSYVTVTIDTKHKARDHYNVHEKLGV